MAGQDFIADSSGALWWEAARTLIVSDLHLEKGSGFAARGVFLPPYDTAETLAALSAAIRRYRPARVISLGDSFHDEGALTRIAPRDRSALEILQHGRDWLWITGNHDAALKGMLPGDHADVLEENGLRFVHEPTKKPKGPEIAGHLHPCAKVRARGRGVRRRAFVSCGSRLVMPAFGAFTGGLNIRDHAIEGLFPRGFLAFVLGEGRTYVIPQSSCLPD
jgi:DNA ligase-associated metallophosphoesterase